MAVKIIPPLERSQELVYERTTSSAPRVPATPKSPPVTSYEPSTGYLDGTYGGMDDWVPWEDEKDNTQTVRHPDIEAMLEHMRSI